VPVRCLEQGHRVGTPFAARDRVPAAAAKRDSRPTPQDQARRGIYSSYPRYQPLALRGSSPRHPRRSGSPASRRCDSRSVRGSGSRRPAIAPRAGRTEAWTRGCIGSCPRARKPGGPSLRASTSRGPSSREATQPDRSPAATTLSGGRSPHGLTTPRSTSTSKTATRSCPAMRPPWFRSKHKRIRDRQACGWETSRIAGRRLQRSNARFRMRGLEPPRGS
jgi:hypothetical protein